WPSHTGGPRRGKVLIKASWPPPRLPRPPGWSEIRRKRVTFAPPRRGSLFLGMGSRRVPEDVAALAPFPRNWRLDSVLGLRLGLCCPNQSPKPSRANSLAFAGAARVVSCKGVNGALIATALSYRRQSDECSLIPA